MRPHIPPEGHGSITRLPSIRMDLATVSKHPVWQFGPKGCFDGFLVPMAGERRGGSDRFAGTSPDALAAVAATAGGHRPTVGS